MTRQRQYLDMMGIQQWIPKHAPLLVESEPVEAPIENIDAPSPELFNPPAEEPMMETPPPDNNTIATVSPERIQHINALDWAALQAEVKECTECDLHQGRTQTVFGVGDDAAKLMIVGEGPGAEEDRRGEPFVGKAGKLLDAMLYAAGFEREQVYIANVVKCRPPNNRNPEPVEMSTCGLYLARQIEIIKPALILAVGKVPAHFLLQQTSAIGAMRGKKHLYAETETPIVVTYHPAYLLRRPEEKYKSWQDLQFVMRLLEGL